MMKLMAKITTVYYNLNRHILCVITFLSSYYMAVTPKSQMDRHIAMNTTKSLSTVNGRQNISASREVLIQRAHP